MAVPGWRAPTGQRLNEVYVDSIDTTEPGNAPSPAVGRCNRAGLGKANLNPPLQ
jgi:hypothetical protein